ncbi:MAG TPA: hypothetical protein VNY31_10490 [Solirubrobacteraceae bacterium]|jgi:hypothetical protein|nr:hypothetical protein [Solirubrobacteraceae bacterium]
MDSEAALRGYVSPRRLRQHRARQAGLASGRKRRACARGRRVGHGRDRQDGLALAYRIQQVPREEFERRFCKLRARQGIRVSERGLETRWVEYRSCMATYRAKGQDFKTTNGQRAEGLRARGRARCPRTVRRAHADLAGMGLLRRAHVRRGGARVGQRDCLRVRLMPSFVPPPSAAGAGAYRPLTAPAPVPKMVAVGERVSAGCAGRARGPAPPAQIVPPDGGRDHQQQHPERESAAATGVVEPEAARRERFEEMWRQARLDQAGDDS